MTDDTLPADNPQRVLLVEDSPADADLIQEMLAADGSAGFQVAWVGSMTEAADHADSQRVDAILLDLNLPDSQGLATVTACCSLCDRAAIIALTGDDRAGIGREVIQHGAQDYLPKNELSPELLKRAIGHALERLRLDRERHTAQEAKNRHEAYYQALIETMVDGVIVIDSRGIIQELNPTAEAIFGYAASELLNANVSALMPEPHRSAHDGYLQRYLETGENRIIGIGREVTGLRRDGTTFPMELAVSEMAIDGQRMFTGIVRDISQRKSMGNDLAQQKERLGLATAAAELGIWDYYVPTGRLEWDEGMFRIYGIREEAFDHAYGTWVQALTADTREQALADIQTGMQSEEPYESEFRIRRADDGAIRTIKAVAQAQRDAEGHVERVVGINEDITERKELEWAMQEARDQAERANQAKSEFLSSMSHELRTPMNAIIGFAQLMAYDDDLPEDHADNVHEILKAGRHLLELINEVLDLAKVESGRIELSLEPVEVAGVMDDVLPLVQTMAQKGGIAISCDELAQASVRADRTRLKQVLLNLVTNAIKYNSQPGQVRIHAEPHADGWLRIGVTDTGPGIPPERIEELFEPFNRLEAEGSATEGTGVGLSFSQRVVELMGGELTVASQVDVGSTFWVALPEETLQPLADQTREEASHAESLQAPATEEHTVLYIEDNPANLKLVNQILAQEPGVHLISAHDAEIGIDLALNNQPQLILLDINLPGMDGYEILEIFQQDDTLSQVPIVAITANAMPHDVERGKRAGFADYLTKPLDVAHFKQIVATYLRDSAPVADQKGE